MHGVIASRLRQTTVYILSEVEEEDEEEEEDDEGEAGRERTPRGVGMMSKMTDLLLLVVLPCL